MDGNTESRVAADRGTIYSISSELALPAATPRILRATLLRGCNAYHARSVMRVDVDFGPLAGRSTASAGDESFAERFVARFQPKPGAWPAHERDSDFWARLRSPDGVAVEEALLQAIFAVEAELLAAMYRLERIAFSSIASAAGSRAVLVWEARCGGLSHRAAELAVSGLADLLSPSISDPGRFELGLEALKERAARRRIPGATALLRVAAQARDIPVVAAKGSQLQLGEGACQRHVVSSLVGSTPFGAIRLALNKRHCNLRLAELFLPVPRQVGGVHDADEARAAVARVGFPAVIKPSKGNQGRGLTVGVSSNDQVGPAFEQAKAHSRPKSGVVVEQHVQGSDHRMLVVGGRMIAALACLPPAVVGDGISTVARLIEALNAEPDRDDERLAPVRVTQELARHLASQDLGLDDVPEAGRPVTLLPFGHLALGGTSVDVTDRVHPDNRDAVERAAVGIGLDVAGIDFMTADVSRSYREIGGAILEVNARPGLVMHAWPRHGAARDVAGPILDLLFPDGARGGVPKLVVAGDRGTGRVARAADALLRSRGLTVGLCLKRDVYLGGAPVDLPVREMSRAPAALLRERTLECLVAAVSLRRTASSGLGLDTCDAAMILPRQHELDGEAFDQGLEVLAKANRGRFVLVAGDAAARAALRDVDPGRLVLVATDPADAQAAAEIAAGHAVVVKRWHEGAPQMTLFDKGAIVAAAPVPDRARTNPRELLAEMGAFALAASVDLP
jgi:cyanophycin synthetase